MLLTIYLTGFVIVSIVLLASEFEEGPMTDQGDLMMCGLFALIWPLFLIALVYDAYRVHRALNKDHDKDRY